MHGPGLSYTIMMMIWSVSRSMVALHPMIEASLCSLLSFSNHHHPSRQIARPAPHHDNKIIILQDQGSRERKQVSPTFP